MTPTLSTSPRPIRCCADGRRSRSGPSSSARSGSASASSSPIRATSSTTARRGSGGTRSPTRAASARCRERSGCCWRRRRAPGRGSGSTFEELAELRAAIGEDVRHRIAFCADTCHLYSAGYDLVRDFDGVWRRWEAAIGLSQLRCLHLNDSKTPFDSRRDRHELIARRHARRRAVPPHHARAALRGGDQGAGDAQGRRRGHPGPSHAATSPRLRARAPGALTRCTARPIFPACQRQSCSWPCCCRAARRPPRPDWSTTRAWARSAPAPCCATSSWTRSPCASRSRRCSPSARRFRSGPEATGSGSMARSLRQVPQPRVGQQHRPRHAPHGHPAARPRGPDATRGSAGTSGRRHHLLAGGRRGHLPRRRHDRDSWPGAGVDYRRPVLPKWDLMTTLRYDFHRFTTDAARARAASPRRQGVSRVSLSVGLSRSCPMSRRGLAGSPPRLVVAGAACGDIATPIRTDFYEWRLIVPAASGSGDDSLTFHWPQERLPVRIWVEDAASLPVNVPAADRCLATRRSCTTSSTRRSSSDSSTADVIVRAGSAPGIQFSRTVCTAPSRRRVRRRHRPGHQRRSHPAPAAGPGLHRPALRAQRARPAGLPGAHHHPRAGPRARASGAIRRRPPTSCSPTPWWTRRATATWRRRRDLPRAAECGGGRALSRAVSGQAVRRSGGRRSGQGRHPEQAGAVGLEGPLALLEATLWANPVIQAITPGCPRRPACR